MTVLYTLIASVLVFGAVIFLHELGHFVTAKMAGIQVNEFALGMGPRLFSFVRGSTRYSLRLLPIGGFVAMEGEDGEEEGDEEDSLYPDIPADAPRGLSFQQAPIWRRMVVIAAGAVMNMILGFVVLVVLVSMQDSITSKTISGFRGDEMSRQTGLQVGDTILAINGRHCFVANDVVYEAARSEEAVADFTVLRNGEKVELQNVTFATALTGEQEGQYMIDFTVLPLEKTIPNVLAEAGNWTISYARLIWRSLVDLVTGRVEVTQLSGPIGIVQAISQAVSIGLDSVLNIMALITINLGIFNLLPFPALDGGKLVLLVLEKIRRRPLPARYESAINLAGFALLMVLMVFVAFNDVLRLVG